MEQNVLVTKMIGIVVAVIVAAVVLVPICNSLTEGDGGSDGGSGSSSSTVPVDGEMLNSISQLLVDDNIETTYAGFDVYPDTSGNYGSFTFTKNDVQKYLDSVTVTGTPYYDTTSIPIIVVDSEYFDEGLQSFSQFHLDISVSVKKADNSKDVTVYGTFFYANGDEVNIGTPLSGGLSINDFSTVSVIIKDNGVADITIVGGNNVDISVTDYPLQSVQCLSDSENSWALFNITPAITSLVVEEGSGVMVSLNLRVYDEGTDTSIRGGDTAIVEVTSEMIDNLEVEHTFTGTFNSESYEITVTLPLRYNENTDTFRVNSNANATITGTYNQDWNVSGRYAFVSVMNTVPASGGSSGGDSSGGSDLGVAGTIIGIIPVFVILAILMGAAGLFYQNRKAI